MQYLSRQQELLRKIDPTADTSFGEDLLRIDMKNPLQVEALYYRYCMDCATTGRSDLVQDETNYMRRDLGFEARDSILIAKHAMLSASHLFRMESKDIVRLFRHIRRLASLTEFVGSEDFSNPSSSLTPYFIGQTLRSLALQHSQHNLHSASRQRAEEVARAKDVEVFVLDADLDMCFSLPRATAIHIALDKNFGLQISLVFLRSDCNELEATHALAHEFVHSHQNFQSREVEEMSLEEREIFQEALTEALVLLRMPEFDPQYSEYIVRVVALLEILPAENKAEYLLLANSWSLKTILDDLAKFHGVTRREVAELFLSNYHDLRSAAQQIWEKRVQIVEHSRKDSA